MPDLCKHCGGPEGHELHHEPGSVMDDAHFDVCDFNVSWDNGIEHAPVITTNCHEFERSCDRDLIGNDCRCDACEMLKVEAAEFAQDSMEDR